MTARGPDTEQLLQRIEAGDSAARSELLACHRARLKRLIALRLDRRLLARLDSSDVVQDVLAEADRKLTAYTQTRPLPFYPWLRELAGERLVKLRRDHLRAQKRDVRREEGPVWALPDESVLEMARRLVDPGTGPSQKVVREEMVQRVRRALERLSERDREVLVLRFLEQMSVREVAAVMGSSEGAVKTRQVRALERLHALLAQEQEDSQP
ncbi:MAG: sigma-70 family RNA polymerase sigma factor [Gemmataceae bacterium]|nr:sigma-70 family RNA polymerase sigma factor [Gemmataceae bacterium]